PRVTGIGYLSYKNSASNIKTNDLDWLDNNIEFPHIQGTNVDGNFENIKLTPDDKLKLQMKLVELNDENKNSGEIEFKNEDGNDVKIIMTKEDIKNEIQKINSRIKTPSDINKLSTLESILNICDNYKEEEYIPYNGMYIHKGSLDIKEEIQDKIEELREKINNNENKEKKKTLLIAENLESNEYVEKDTVSKYKHIVEAPKGLKEGIKLFDYQNECLEKLQNLYLDSNINGFLLCDDMGLGKTLQLLSFMAWLKDREELKPSIVVAPTSLLNNWDSNESGEIQKFFKENLFDTEKVRGRVTSKDIERLKEKDIVFITYESLRMNNIALGRINWKVMICDEAQKIKNPKTMVTIAAKAQNANFKIICSATPIENTIEDLWTLVDYSKPGLLGSLKDFKSKYINKYKNATDQQLEELNDELYSKIEDFYIRREKDILPKSLPKKIIKIYKKKPTNIEVDYLEKIKDTEEHALSAIQKMLMVCSHVDVLNNDESIDNIEDTIKKSSKLKTIKSILEDIKIKDEKVIIFTRVRKVQQILYKSIKHWFNIESFVVNGELTNLDKRTEIINNFRKSKGFNIIILSPEVAGFGITITEANHVIHYTRLWNPAKEDQATDRAYRIGQTKDVYVHYPIITFEEEEICEYDNVHKYVEENIVRNRELLSPEEKLNILLARKKDMLINFFLAAGNGDIGSKDFLGLDEKPNEKSNLNIEAIDKNIISPHEFEGLVAVLYEKLGYKSYLTSKSNDNGVDVICKNDNEIIFIQCKKTKHSVGAEAVKDLLYAKDKYNQYIKGMNVRCIVVTSSNNVAISVRERSDIELVDGEKLSILLNQYKIYKDEIDVIENDRYSFEKMIRLI
ncbi:MAG: restriction endonuclease, partial [Peptostreptococcaceae bacterium]|nr:restriction endonuclease [Peptostreptococcaceae bacterium]